MSRGDGYLFRKPGSRFVWMGFYVNGRLRRESTRETDERKALRALKQRVAEVRAATYKTPARDVRLRHVLDCIVSDYEARGLRSIATLKFQLQHLRDYFGDDERVSALNLPRLNRYVADRRKQGAAHNSIRGEMAHLSRALKLAVRAGILLPQQVPAVPSLPEDKSKRRRGFVYREQLVELLAGLDPDSADFIEFLFFSGWRKSEARSIEWRDYDRHIRALRLREEISKTKEPRILPLAGPVAKIIERRLAKRRPDCVFIFHRNGKRIGDFRKTWRKAKGAIGRPELIKHDLRRSSVTHNTDAGLDQKTVMELSGHKTPDVYRRYMINDAERLREAVERAGLHRAGSPRETRRRRTKS